MSTAKGAVRPRSGKRHSGIFRLLDWVTAAVIAAAAIALVLFVVFTPVRVKSSGVSGFNAGDIVFADRLSKHFVFYSRGDAVVMREKTADGAELHILRVIAFTGEKVTVADGRVYIDGALLDESAYAEPFGGGVEASFLIPADSVLLLPDERSGMTADELINSVAPLSSVTGEVRFIAYPLSRIAVFG